MNNIHNISRSLLLAAVTMSLVLPTTAGAQLLDSAARNAKREQEIKTTSEQFSWWPTDAKPAPVKDTRGGYWWWPDQPGTEKKLWGNRGYIYVYKVIYDYKAEEDDSQAAQPVASTAQKPAEPVKKPSLIIKKILRNVKIYFDYNKANLRDDHMPILDKAVKALDKNPETSVLITGNCDARGSEEYNLKLGKKRGEAVKQFFLDNGIPESRIKIVSRGKLDAVAPVSDLMGMQKDRNAQFMVAEVEEVMMASGEKPTEPEAKAVDDGKYLVEKKENVESAPKVSTREYTIQANDSLWKIAAKEMGNGNRWKYLYEINKDRINNPNKLRKGTVIIIPIE